MTLAAETLQRAIFTALSTNTAVKNRVSGVYDEVPSPAIFPYLLFGETRVQDASTASIALERITLELFAISIGKGRLEMLQLVEEVRAALASPLSLSGWRCVSLRLGTINFQIRENGRLRRVLMPIEAWLEPQA